MRYPVAVAWLISHAEVRPTSVAPVYAVVPAWTCWTATHRLGSGDIESARPAIQVVGIQAEVQPSAHETTLDQYLGVEQIVQRQHSRHSATQHAYSEAVVTVREMDQIHHAPVPLIRHRSPAHPVDGSVPTPRLVRESFSRDVWA